MSSQSELSEAGKQELAMALLLLKDFKSDGCFDLEITTMILQLVDWCDVRSQFEQLMPKVPPMKVMPRYT
jgi:hypothetical protein